MLKYQELRGNQLCHRTAVETTLGIRWQLLRIRSSNEVHNRSFSIFCSLAAPIPAGGEQNHQRLGNGAASKKVRVEVNIDKGGVDSAGSISQSSPS